MSPVAMSTAAGRRTVVLCSTVTLKAAMAVSGLVMVLYLLAHMYGNFKVFSGRAAFDGYSHHLRTMGEPFLPYAGALWVIRVVLLASVVVHAYTAVVLWRRARIVTAGRGGWRYESRQARRGVQRSYASFTLRWGGVVIALFVVYHLLHLTRRFPSPGGGEGVEGDLVAHLSELVEGALFGLVGVEPGVVVAAEIVVVDAVGDHVPDRDEDGVLDGDDRFDWSAPRRDAPVFGGQVGVAAAGR